VPDIDIKIIRHGDPPPWGEVMMEKQPPLLASESWRLVALEGGMSSGAPSIALWLETDDGPVIAQTSLTAWVAATCALRGAFPSVFDGTPLAER
jgi:hypothetical protein